MSDNNAPDVIPATLAPMKAEDVKQRAQRILDHRGRLPWNVEAFEWPITADEAAVLSEFVQFWLSYLTIKEKK